MSRHGQRCGRRIGVATPPGGRDLEWLEWCRDTKLMSRHGLASRRSRPGNDVATWLGARQGKEVVTCAHDLGVVRAAAPTTWALRAQCARDLGFGCAHCAPNQVLIQCTVLQSLFGHYSWTLFMDTVHEHCSQGF